MDTTALVAEIRRLESLEGWEARARLAVLRFVETGEGDVVELVGLLDAVLAKLERG